MVRQAYDETKLKNTVVALGKFQGLHKGHMLLIDKAVEISKEEKMQSVICSIDFANQKKINTSMERFDILENKGINYLIECKFDKEFASMSPEIFFDNILIDRLGAKYVIVGEDFRFGYNRLGDVDSLRSLCNKNGVKLIVIKRLYIDEMDVSTSYIKSLIMDGKMEDVSRFLGRNYQICGIVKKGRQLGRTIGFPTVNIIPDKEKLIPMFGVYKSKTFFDDKEYLSITNVGNNPTIDLDNKITIETNIIGFEGDLYNKNIKVELIGFVRGEQKFNSIEELQAQINIDKAIIMHQ